MKKLWNLGILFVGFLTACQSGRKEIEPIIKSDAQMEQKIDSILNKMTLEDKVGQMTQLSVDVFGGSDANGKFQLDPNKVDSIFRIYKVGSVLNTALNTPMEPSRWTEIITELQKKSIEINGIPIIYGVDEVHGATYTAGATMFPQQIAMGATFNPEMVRQMAEVSAYEVKAGSIPWNFSPILDLGRDARWPRMWETFGEDPYLVSVMGKNCILGYQGTDPNHIGKNHVAACLKHFMAYGSSQSGKDRTPSYVGDNEMRERYFAPFLASLKAGALSVMVNSGINNGMPFHANKKFLTQWLKEDLNWDGVVVTDWADIINIYNRDKVAENHKEAICLAINAGIDMSMVPYDFSFGPNLIELVKEGRVLMIRIDDAVRRILRMKYRLGLFDQPFVNTADYPKFASKEHSELAKNVAAEAITLLKNESNILPLKQGARILLAGPNANSMRTLNGAWTYSWQGDKTERFAEQYNTILEAMQNQFGAANVMYEPGVIYNMQGKYFEENAPQIEKAVAKARSVDYIVLCLGENSYCETPGNLDDLTLSENQLKLAEALAATKKPIILVLNEGRPRIISRIEPLMKAVVDIYLTGNYGGDALAEILAGKVNPSGKLPFTYPKYVNALTNYDHKPCESIDKMQGAYDYDAVRSVQWAFGYGLSYTKFKYENLKVEKANFTVNDTLNFSVDVTNVGDKEGKETVLLFTSDKVASLSPDVRRLRAFEKINLKPSEKKTVNFKLPASDLAFVGYEGKWILEKGDFSVNIDSLVIDLHCDQSYEWRGPNK
ncbi:MAG: glycoside hydrolase family 3 C-terminal domain-containing protein [Paludibacteraceae bacterium]|nr:glycoside hydrolase family 3 C-terminal domain-containing protein [Paludibacteraceae bacterium]